MAVEEKRRAARRIEMLPIFDRVPKKQNDSTTYVIAFLKTALANSAYSIAALMSLPSVSDTFSQ